MLSLKKLLVLATSLTSARQAGGSLDAWLATQYPIARQGVLDNIGAGGARALGAGAGVVVASPSKTAPPCQHPLNFDHIAY